jgi:hypothetical protein
MQCSVGSEDVPNLAVFTFSDVSDCVDAIPVERWLKTFGREEFRG